ncbi:MAG: molybdopterin-dependent oxidoreductase [Desulfobacterales bacterium]|nr:molybdopterin-dependent oxidoreductase [Desulfobacterales bacterium]
MKKSKWRWEEDGMTVTRTTPWTGPGCHNACGLLVYSKDNKIIKVEGDAETPFSRGRLCPRCLALRKVVHHPDRLTHPLKRAGRRGEGKWDRISWDQAYDMILENVRTIQKEYGPEAISTWHGTGRNVWHLGAKLSYSGFGSPNLTSLLSGMACYGPKIVLSSMTTGFLPLPDVSQMFADRYENPDWTHPKCLIIWGNNPVVSQADSVRGDWFVECMKRGTELIVVDPRLTWIASRAKIWLQLRPGTDAAVGLGMLHVIIEEELYDKDFVENWTEGFDKLKERVKTYTPQVVEEISWVPKEKLIAAARFYARSKPAAIQWGVTVEQHKNGMSNLLAIQDLWGITGNVDVPGGNIISKPNKFYRVPDFMWGWKDLDREMRKKRIGFAEYPTVTIAHPDLITDAIVTGKPYPIKMAWIQGTNPLACIAANPRYLYRGIENLDFVVVLDLFMTPSAMAMGDLILPVSSALERDTIRAESWGNAWWGPARAINKIIQVGECKSDEEILLEVGKRLNPEAFPWKDVEEMLDFLLKPSGETFAQLREKGIPEYYPFEYRKYEKGLLVGGGQKGFNTATGKFMLYAPEFEKSGADSLPYYEEPPLSPVSSPEAKEYPLVLTTGYRTWGLFHSEHRQIPELREIQYYPEVEIHPDTAGKNNIKDGDWVWIENNIGRCRQKAKVTPTIHPQVINAGHGWWYPEKPGPEPDLFGVWESNVNQCIPGGQQGPTGWCAPYKSSICKIYKDTEGLE